MPVEPRQDTPLGDADCRLLRGAVDGHIHACPHLNARRLNALEAAEQADRAGFAGIGLMDNFSNSAAMAALVGAARSQSDLDVFGGLIMEPQAGGISVEAVSAALGLAYHQLDTPKRPCRFISLPTHHTRHVAKAEGRSRAYIDACFAVPESGPLPDAVLKILDLIAASDVVLNVGHLSALEALRVTELAKAAGVRRILVPANSFTVHDVADLTGLGAVVELSFFFMSPAAEVGLTHVDKERHTIGRISASQMAELAMAAPPGSLILSSDCGVSILPTPVEGLLSFVRTLEACGVPNNTLAEAIRHTPARLFKVGSSEATSLQSV
ncbi:MAG: DUF6282 family protein [Pseudomonadota bacterium]